MTAFIGWLRHPFTQAPPWWSRKSPISCALVPLSWLYAAAVWLRGRLTTPHKISVPVICIGNLVAGGAGKTPVALAVAKLLRGKNKGVHFLTRGYGGSLTGPVRADPLLHTAADIGDEALLLARMAPCWVARDRVAGARAAAQAGAEIIVMDDGFQNPRLHKDVSLLVIDGATGLGNGRVIPAGPLRECPRQGLRRTTAVVVLGEPGDGTRRALADFRAPVLHAFATHHSAQELRGKRVVAFAGIGRPQKFFASLETFGCTVAEAAPFPDHHPYSAGELAALEAKARKHGALLVTTAKDAARLPADFLEKVVVVSVEIRWKEEAMINDLLASVLA